MQNLQFRKYVNPILWMLILLSQGVLFAQHSLPDSTYNPLKIRVNLIILQRQDGTGNFQDNAADRAFLHNMISVTNTVFANLSNRNEEYYPGQNLPYVSNAKLEIVSSIQFVQDERGWNNRNDTNSSGVPYRSGWYLDSLDQAIYTDSTMPKAINLYFTTDGQLYDQMVVSGATTDYNQKVFFKQHAASEIPVVRNHASPEENDFHTMRCHIANVWLKLWWKRNVLHEPDWTMEYEVGKSIAHELGHLMGLEHTPDTQTDALMRTKFGGLRDYMSTREIAKIHQAFRFYPSLWQFVDAGITYGSPTADWIITSDETWAQSRRLYANVVVKAGATLSIRGDLYMPFNSSIIVEAGAKLVVEEGRIKTIDAGSNGQLAPRIVDLTGDSR